MAKQEDQPVPPATLLDLFEGYFHRQDKLLEYMVETQRQILALMRAISGVPSLPLVLPPAPGVAIEVSGITEEALKKLMATPLPVMAYPLGRVKKKGNLAATTTEYVTVCEITVTSEKEFQLGNFCISADQDILAKLVWQDKDLTPAFYVMGELPFDKFFLPHYQTDEGKPLVGDGKSTIKLQACYPTGGTASTYCEGEIVGDEI